MAFELPVVAFDRWGTRISVGDAKVRLKPNDVHDYATATVELLDDPRRTRLGRPGHALVELELGWCHQEHAYLGVYRRLTDGTRTLERTAGVDVRDRGCYQQNGQELVAIMSDRIAHRGLDANETWIYEDNEISVSLGYRRLSIIDVSAGTDQPLSKHGLIRADKLRRLIQVSRSAVRTAPSTKRSC